MPQQTISAENWIICAHQQVGTPLLIGELGEEKRETALARLIRPTGTPDVDNVAKLVLDAVVELKVAKFYSEQPETILRVWQLTDRTA